MCSTILCYIFYCVIFGSLSDILYFSSYIHLPGCDVFIDCEQNGDTSKPSPGRTLRPLVRPLLCIDCEQNGDASKQSVSRHAMGTIITGPTFMRKILCSSVDDFLLVYAALLMVSP